MVRNRCKLYLIAILFTQSILSYAQDKSVHHFVKSHEIIHWQAESRSFLDHIDFRMTSNNERENYKYTYRDDSLEISYMTSVDSCDFFIIKGKRFMPSDIIKELSVCELDITSFEIYKGHFKDKNYILLIGNNNGSGKSVSNKLCFLLDISDKEQIKVHNLWSKFGDASCFEDFNNDGVLDFLKIRAKDDILVFSLMTLKPEGFIDIENYQITTRYKDGFEFEIIESNWW